VYKWVRQLLYDFGLDEEHYGTPKWDPLGQYVTKGANIVIRPNWVWDPPYCFKIPESLLTTITHSSFVRVLLDFAYIAVGDKGRISIIDSPIEDANWTRFLRWSGFDRVLSYYNKHTRLSPESIDLRDFRTLHSRFKILVGKNKVGLAVRQQLPGDPRGYIKFTLREKSEFNDPSFSHFELLRSPQKWTSNQVFEFHTPSKHDYYVSRTLLEADLILNVPKLKFHKKAGITLGLKSVIGATHKKNGLPHFRKGPPPQGDEYPYAKPIESILKENLSNLNLFSLIGLSINYDDIRKRESSNKMGFRKIRVGDWYGADTLWRTILDLNKAVLCGNKSGVIHDERQRHCLIIVDGIIGGEKQSPLHPTPKKAGLILISEDPVAVDTAASYLIGFDPQKISLIKKAQQLESLRPDSTPLESVRVKLNGEIITTIGGLRTYLKKNPKYITQFTPSVGWKNHIEFDRSS
jgi:hypothetical protein